MSPSPPRFTPEPFRPIPALAGPHAQTVVATLIRPGSRRPLRRERWETPDGDFLDVDFLDAPKAGPWVVLLHGLEGSSRAGYIAETLRGIERRGWGAVAVNFRSCSGESNRLARSYNSGDTTDARMVIARLRERGHSGPLYGVGFSLGGSVLLNLMAEGGEDCPLDAAAAVSVPFDLSSCAGLLDQGRGFTALYRLRFLRTLKQKSVAKAAVHPGALDPAAIRRAGGIRAFDDAVTARLYGFRDAEDYYQQCSSGPKLARIRRPTLILTSADDPLAPAGKLPRDARENPWLSVVVTERGGHVGFLAGSLRHPRFWAEDQALRFFDALR